MIPKVKKIFFLNSGIRKQLAKADSMSNDANNADFSLEKFRVIPIFFKSNHFAKIGIISWRPVLIFFEELF